MLRSVYPIYPFAYLICLPNPSVGIHCPQIDSSCPDLVYVCLCFNDPTKDCFSSQSSFHQIYILQNERSGSKEMCYNNWLRPRLQISIFFSLICAAIYKTSSLPFFLFSSISKLSFRIYRAQYYSRQNSTYMCHLAKFTEETTVADLYDELLKEEEEEKEDKIELDDSCYFI